jgi:hypothetical protein
MLARICTHAPPGHLPLATLSLNCAFHHDNIIVSEPQRAFVRVQKAARDAQLACRAVPLLRDLVERTLVGKRQSCVNAHITAAGHNRPRQGRRAHNVERICLMHLAVQRRHARSTAVGGDLIAEQSVETVHTAQQQPLLLVKHLAHFRHHAPMLLGISHAFQVSPAQKKSKKNHSVVPANWPAMREA